ncbi:probable pectate lyase 16 [Asparagus officinalis]|uniref:probable pectate lyase 16 n=1 Tax=Asparagus officinalis TaxID=4686 RepID=UPI00098E04F7|nr:probable pectate lyase 16 [Asparagus officinalis]
MTQNVGPGLRMYKVTDPSDDPVNPRPGTLRYGATTIAGKVWISFEGDVLIKLRRPLLVSSYTAIDGRGANVRIENGDGFLLREVKNVIIHGLNFHHNQPTTAGPVVGPGGAVDDHGKSDGDAISIMHSNNIWIDHNTLSQGQDGLIDVTHGSTNVTISNNWFMDHDKVMLLGHSDTFVEDSEMKVTVAFNRFGPNCNQRMPRVRRGYAHVVNNFYDGWKEYAIGGSMNPSITSQANVFVAPESNKEVAWEEPGNAKWNFKSVGDGFVNGARFGQANESQSGPLYASQQMFTVGKQEEVRSLTRDAGALKCHGKTC